jgi:hypothetical protein
MLVEQATVITPQVAGKLSLFPHKNGSFQINLIPWHRSHIPTPYPVAKPVQPVGPIDGVFDGVFWVACARHTGILYGVCYGVMYGHTGILYGFCYGVNVRTYGFFT